MKSFFFKINVALTLFLLSYCLGHTAPIATENNSTSEYNYTSRGKGPLQQKNYSAIKFGYTGFFNAGYSHILEVGYYHMMDHMVLTYGPSVSLLGRYRDGKFMLGPQMSYEFSFFCMDAKLAVNYLHPTINIHPSVGLSFFNIGGIHLGYNMGILEKHYSGLTLGVYYNFAPLRKL